MRVPILRPYDEEEARRVARIVGESSATAKALRCLDDRRAAGEQVGLFLDRSDVVVAPIVPPEQQIPF